MATTIYISDALEKKLKRFKDLYTSRISLELSLSRIKPIGLFRDIA